MRHKSLDTRLCKQAMSNDAMVFIIPDAKTVTDPSPPTPDHTYTRDVLGWGVTTESPFPLNPSRHTTDYALIYVHRVSI